MDVHACSVLASGAHESTIMRIHAEQSDAICHSLLACPHAVAQPPYGYSGTGMLPQLALHGQHTTRTLRCTHEPTRRRLSCKSQLLRALMAQRMTCLMAERGQRCRGSTKQEPGRSQGKARAQPQQAPSAQAEAPSGASLGGKPGPKRFQPAVRSGSSR